MSDRAYVLGHSERELARLADQARMIGPMTRRTFRDAGIASGMRVMDVGSGVGDVAFLAAELAGSTGEVVGFDRVPVALEVARRRAAERSLTNVTFCDGDPTEATVERPFDAIVGRYVLMFQPDPAAMLRRLVRHLRPGGLVVFHEVDWDGFRSSPHAPLYEAACRWIIETVRRSGASTTMASSFPTVFAAAGLPRPAMRLEAQIGAGPTAADLVRLTSEIVISLLPEIERLGLATQAEIAPETLSRRMIDETNSLGSVLVGRSEVGAWARTASR